MNTEIERKYRINDYISTKDKIQKLGAILKGSSHGVDTYFVVPQEVPNTLYLRLRQKGQEESMTLAYHHVVDNDKTLEWETVVENGKIAQEIIEKLGFSIDVNVDKRRETFIFGDSEIVMDEVVNLGYFIEIESPSVKRLEEIVQLISIDESTIISGVGYPDLVRDAINTQQ